MEKSVNQMASYTSGTSTEWPITGITPGTYTLTITASNNFGTSSALSLGSVTLPARKLFLIAGNLCPTDVVIITYKPVIPFYNN